MTIAKRLLVVVPESPWPAMHGGQVDIWNRYEGLKAEGWELGLVVWTTSGQISNADSLAIVSVFSKVVEIPLSKTLGARFGRIMRMAGLPSQAALLHADAETRDAVSKQLLNFGAAAVVSEGIHCSILAKWLADELHVPMLVRPQNVEHKYMATQFNLAKRIKQRLQIGAARLNLKRFEYKRLGSAWSVLDISETDAQFWRDEGMSRVRWVPSFFPKLQSSPPNGGSWAERPYDVGYLGNLWAPNNVAALNWFMDEILPLIRAARPDVRVMIAGSKASSEFAAKIAGTQNVTYVPNPPDAGLARAGARVLINPIREGSGINTKSVEMLYADSPVVVTSFAIAGMSAQARGAFEVADEPAEFARKVIDGLEQPYNANNDRVVMRDRFGRGGAQAKSQILLDEIAAFKNRKAGAI